MWRGVRLDGERLKAAPGLTCKVRRKIADGMAAFPAKQISVGNAS
jgi:hypothetical protein